MTTTEYASKTESERACVEFVRWWTGLPWSIRESIIRDAYQRCGALPGSFPLLDIVKKSIGGDA